MLESVFFFHFAKNKPQLVLSSLEGAGKDFQPPGEQVTPSNIG